MTARGLGMSKTAIKASSKSQTTKAVGDGFIVREMVVAITSSTTSGVAVGRVPRHCLLGEVMQTRVVHGLLENVVGKTVVSAIDATITITVWCRKPSAVTTTAACRTLAILSERTKGRSGPALLFDAAEIGQMPKRYIGRSRAKERLRSGRVFAETDGEMRRTEGGGRTIYSYAAPRLDCYFLVRPRRFFLLHSRTAEENYFCTYRRSVMKRRALEARRE